MKNSQYTPSSKKLRGKYTKHIVYQRPNLHFHHHPNRYFDTQIFNQSIKNFLSQSIHFMEKMKLWRTGIDFSNEDVKINPYFLGIWLGDGTSSTSAVTNLDELILDEMYREANDRGLYVNIFGKNKISDVRTYHITGKRLVLNSLLKDLQFYNLIHNKHIPYDYILNDKNNRLELLAGLIDSDGHLNRSSFEITQKRESLADDICFLARSLGLAAYKKRCEKSCQTGAIGTYFRILISGNCSIIPTRLPRKVSPERLQIKNVLVTGINLTNLNERDYCFNFVLDNNIFLLDDNFTVLLGEKN